MSEVGLEVAIILLLTIVNGVFAMSEASLLSARRVRLQQRASEGNRGSAAALQLMSDPNNFLSTVQVGITLIGVFAGAFGGAMLAGKVARLFLSVDFLHPYANQLALACVVVLITFLSLIIGELVPKRIALNNPERVASLISRPMMALSNAATPIVRFLSVSTNLLLTLLRVKPAPEPAITEQEIRALVRQGTETGEVHPAEHRMVEGVFQFGEQRAVSFMTPRRKVVWLDINDTLEENKRIIASSPFSRFPVCNGTLDNVLGILKTKDLLRAEFRGEEIDLKKLSRPPLYVPEIMPALQVVAMFKQSKTHIALVVDEHGAVAGLITLNDIAEAVLGDMPSLTHSPEELIIRRPDGSWLVSGETPIHTLKEQLGLRKFSDEEDSPYQTIAGLIIHHLQRLPKAGEHLDWEGMRFEILDMDGPRIDKVSVTRTTRGQRE